MTTPTPEIPPPLRKNPNRRWQQNWQFPTKKAIDSALQLASALSYLHSRAIEGSFVVHRDLKPENIAFSSDGRLKLFGTMRHTGGGTRALRGRGGGGVVGVGVEVGAGCPW